MVPSSWNALPRRARWTAAAYVAGFAEGTGAHAYDVLTAGAHAYPAAPAVIRALFYALLAVDAVVAVLVLRGSQAGPLSAAAVMLADGTANWWLQAGDVVRHPARYLVPVGLLPITVFGVFVLATAVPLSRAMAPSP